jgi:eukaryotic-like serine/threonine-protein kinase
VPTDPESTVTFHGDWRGVRGRVVLTDTDSIESELIGSRRPSSFEERYPLTARIGEGGMGDVHLAQDRILGRDVAVKVLRQGKHPDRLVLQRFLRETQVTAQLSHPNVIPCYGLESTGDSAPAFVMKLVEGITFKEYVEDCRSAHDASTWNHDEHGLKARIEHFVKVCDAVAYGHERGVIHRDLKPANVMLGDHSVVYVMDWGIAKVIGDHGDRELFAGAGKVDPESSDTRTQTGDLVGTPMYMSPEQVNLDSDQLTVASDQYSLGLLLFNLVTGEAPRVGGCVIEVIQSAERGGHVPYPTGGIGDEAPKELRAIIDRATRANPALRYPSVSEMAADLRRFLHGDPVKACPDSFLRAIWRRVQKHPVKVLAALLLVVVAAAGVTTKSLWDGVKMERLRLFENDVASQLAEHVNYLDSRIARSEYLLGVLATEVGDLLRWAPEGGGDWTSVSDLRGDEAPADLIELERYGFEVSFSRCVGVLAPGVESDSVRGITAHFERLEDLLKGAFGRTSQSRLEEESAQYVYLGFEEGILINYPATDRFDAEFDPRRRPWYTRGIELSLPSWGPLYQDVSGSGYLLPCNVAIKGEGGEVIGVAGMDITLKRALAAFTKLGLEGVEDAYLVDSEARVLFGMDDLGRDDDVPAGSNDNRERVRPLLRIPGITESIREGDRLGFQRDGDDLYVFARMRMLDWTLVVRVVVPSSLG